MASEWCDLCWGDLVSLEYGRAIRGHKTGAGPFRVFGTNGPIGWHTEALCFHPGVIIGRKGAYRGVHYSPTPFFVIDTAFYLEPKTEIDLRWAYYELLTQDINSMDSGSAIPSTSRESFYALPVRVPPLIEQHAIAHILGTLDDKIELSRRMNETLEAIARAIFKSWFVDFDPVIDNALRAGNPIPSVLAEKAARRRELLARAKADGRDSCFPKHIADLFPNRLVESDLGEIPKGWGVKKLGEIADVNWGDTDVTKKLYVKQGYKAYSAKGPDGFLSYFDNDRSGIVLSAIGENSGFTWFARGKWSCIKNTIRFWSTDSQISNEYLYFATYGKCFWPIRGSAQPFISQSDARNVSIIYPINGIAIKFREKIENFFIQIDFNDEQSHTIAALRDALLPKLISGEIRIAKLE